MENNTTKYGPIIKDAIILMAFSSIFAVICNYGFKALKGSGATTDPIIASIIQNDVEQIKKLIAEQPARVDILDEQGRTPLMWAAYVNFKSDERITKNEAKRVEATSILLENKANPDLADTDGWTALMWAAWSGFPKVAERLLDGGAAIAAVDKRGHTALMIAAMRGNAPIVQLLIDRGADRNAKNADGETAADLARKMAAKFPDKNAGYETIRGLLP